MKVKFFNKYPTPVDIETDKKVEVYIDEFNFNLTEDDVIRIVILEEPLRGPLYTLAKKHPECYNYLLTYQDDLLQTNPKARLFRCADTWVHGYVPPEKRFSVSTVIGGKSDTRMEGYAMRHELWRRKEQIKISREFYLSKNFIWYEADYREQLILGPSKTPLFDCMFHVAIENTSIKHYFSEKLLDCFQTRTVPIYCGCTNIGDYFDIRGIFVVRNVEEIISICNMLTPKDYEYMLPFIEINYALAQKRVNYFDQLKDMIVSILEEIK